MAVSPDPVRSERPIDCLIAFFRDTQLFWVGLLDIGAVTAGIALSFNDTIGLAGMAGALAAIAIFTFMAVYAYSPRGSSDISEEGRVRKAIAASFVLFYLALVPMILMHPMVQERVEGVEQLTRAVSEFTDTVAKSERNSPAALAEAGEAIEASSDAIKEATQGVANRILTHFTTLVGVVVAFYFGATAVVDRARKQEGTTQDEAGSQ